MSERWVVQYIDGDGSDEWQLIRNDHKKYFSNELEAKLFANEHLFPKKQFYWQPSVWKEVEVEFNLKRWERA